MARERPPRLVEAGDRMKRLLLAALSLALLAPVTAQAEPIADRQALMKRMGALVGRELAPFAKGDTPYDAAVVLSTLQKLDAEAQTFDVATLFPAGSDTGDTKVSAKIWEDPAGFQAAVDSYKADIAKAVAAAPQDAATLAPLVNAIGGHCRSCHSDWRG
jgi:cytochrome c556